MIFVKGRRIAKAWGMRHLTPSGPAMIRNPPAQAFKPPHEEDAPAFAHDGRGEVLPGEWQNGDHGERHFVTPAGSYQHGIDAAATRLGWFLKKYKIDGNPVELIDEAIHNFNHKHTSHKDLDDKNNGSHSLPFFDNMAWRKVRAGILPPGDSSREISERPTKTKNGTLVTNYTNKNFQETPNGRFIESYAIPFNVELGHVLEDRYNIPWEQAKELSFVKKPYIYARETAPQGLVESSHNEHPGQVTPKEMGGAPEGYFSDQTAAHTESTTHHLPDIFFYPNLKQTLEKKGKKQSWDHQNGLYQAAEKAISTAASNIDAVPDVPATINMGTMSSPEMIQRPLREIIQDPMMRKKLIEDMSHVPAMMYLFGRPGQGDFKRHFDNLMGLYGADEEGLSYDEHSQYFKPGAGGSKGKDTTAARVMALAHKSGVSEDNPERSNLSSHSIDAEQLTAFGVNYNEGLMGQVDRFRGIIEALADHQAEAKNLPVKMALGDINTQAMQGLDYHGYPEEGMDVSLEPHMDAYLHGIDDYERTSSMPVHTNELEQVPPDDPVSASLAGPSVSSPPPTGGTPPQRVGVVPQGPPATPLDPRFQQFRPSIAEQDPQRFREMMTAGGGGRASPAPSPELTPIEARAQRSLSDPRQQLLDQYMRSEDAHLPVMDRVMKALERMQQEEAAFDGIKLNSNLNNPHTLAKHVGLTASEVVTINQTMGDWHNIAKSYNVDAKIIKVIKTNMG